MDTCEQYKVEAILAENIRMRSQIADMKRTASWAIDLLRKNHSLSMEDNLSLQRQLSTLVRQDERQFTEKAMHGDILLTQEVYGH